MEIEDIIEGNHYYSEDYGGDCFIIKGAVKQDSENLFRYSAIDIKSKAFKYRNMYDDVPTCNIFKKDLQELRKATPEEKAWLTRCIVNRKYIDNPASSFELPKKWCVRLDKETQSTINRWGNKTFDTWGDLQLEWGKYMTSKYPENSASSSSNETKNGHTEITFEQFKKYVLKEPKLKEVDIEGIGWNANMDCMIGEEVVVRAVSSNGGILHGSYTYPKEYLRKVNKVKQNKVKKDEYKQDKSNKGQAVKISKLLPRVRTGQRPSGTRIRGRARKLTIKSRYISHSASAISS